MQTLYTNNVSSLFMFLKNNTTFFDIMKILFKIYMILLCYIRNINVDCMQLYLGNVKTNSYYLRFLQIDVRKRIFRIFVSLCDFNMWRKIEDNTIHSYLIKLMFFQKPIKCTSMMIYLVEVKMLLTF